MRMAASKIIDPTTGRPFERPAQQPRAPRPRTRYDAAQTTDDNRRHWASADALSARAANTLDVRVRLRNRSRYECANNGYFGGLVLTLANDLVGTGPRLQVLTSVEEVNTTIEQRWGEWAEAVGLAEKLHTGKQAKTRDGEGIWLLATNPAIDDPVQLDLAEIECDQMSTPWLAPYYGQSRWVDGIEFDQYGNPAHYHILKEHPGDLSWPGTAAGWGEYDRVPARHVIHWFRRDRPGQARGIPEITPSLGIGAQMRRWTLATLTAAETAASFAAVLKTEAPPDADTSEPTPFETLEIERGMMTTLPAGADMEQFEPTQPTTTYPAFKQELLKEQGRPVNAPYCVTAGDASPYNFSSARLDRLLYQAALRVERGHCRRRVLEPIFRAWYAEARLAGILPEGMPERPPRHAWVWPGFGAVDPLKEAMAESEALASGTTTLARLLAEQGEDDWEAHLRQRGREIALMRELGIPVPGESASGGGTNGERPLRDGDGDGETGDGKRRRPPAEEEADAQAWLEYALRRNGHSRHGRNGHG